MTYADAYATVALADDPPPHSPRWARARYAMLVMLSNALWRLGIRSSR